MNQISNQFLSIEQIRDQYLNQSQNAKSAYVSDVAFEDVLRQKQNETDIEFYERCVDWYATDTDKKVRVIKVTRSFTELEEHRKNLIVMANEIEGCKHFYRNPSACTCYNRRCEYSQVCLNYNPQLEYVEFEKKKRYTESVEEEGLF